MRKVADIKIEKDALSFWAYLKKKALNQPVMKSIQKMAQFGKYGLMTKTRFQLHLNICRNFLKILKTRNF